MLDRVRAHSAFAPRYRLVCDALGVVPHTEMQKDPAFVHRNVVSSLLTVLVSSISLDWYLEAKGRDADCVAGYSVGHWTALYAAGCLPFEQLVEVITQRAGFMDTCVAGTPGAMMAVIGVSRERIERWCEELRDQGHPVFVGNVNCPGQYSVSGTERAIEVALERIRTLTPKIAVRLPVAGAWHCPLMQPAAEAFRAYLTSVTLRPPRVPVISDVTGTLLPADTTDVKALLGRHVCSPVLWEPGIRSLLARGCRSFVELGFGNTLTKFGFFIDRSVSHTSFTAAG